MSHAEPEHNRPQEGEEPDKPFPMQSRKDKFTKKLFGFETPCCKAITPEHLPKMPEMDFKIDQPKPTKKLGNSLIVRTTPDPPKPTGESCTCGHATCACPVHWPLERKEEPTGEWTVERLANSLDENGIIKTTNLINAALAAERKRKLFAFMRENDQLKQQLAAEQEKVDISIEQWRKIAADSANENLQLRSQLSEHEKAILTLTENCKHWRTRLAAAQAAIAAHNKLSNERALGCPIAYGDTTALDAAIAAAQQPLVEAGKKMRLSCGIAEDCMEWDAELAKVKEGK